MAIGIGEGAELQVPMARVLIGGLISSTFMTLFLIPTLFLILERLWSFRRRETPNLALGQPSSVTN
jgi:HAE1 family hydrophobic/amphiphilic exporter-1